MITPREYIQLKAFARQDGFFIGLLFVFTFVCFVESINYPELQIGLLACIILTPILSYMRLRYYRDKVLNGAISYTRALAFLMLTLCYASTILAAAAYLYFYFLDNGTFMNTLQQNIAMPEIQKAIKDAGMSMKDINEQLTLVAESRPIDLAFNIFFNGIMTSSVLAAILALFGKRVKTVAAEG